jgi:hypothetical protein
MTIKEIESIERVNKIQKGLDLAYQKMIAEKRAKNEDIVIIRNNEIVTIKP